MLSQHHKITYVASEASNLTNIDESGNNKGQIASSTYAAEARGALRDHVSRILGRGGLTIYVSL